MHVKGPWSQLQKHVEYSIHPVRDFDLDIRLTALSVGSLSWGSITYYLNINKLILEMNLVLLSRVELPKATHLGHVEYNLHFGSSYHWGYRSAIPAVYLHLAASHSPQINKFKQECCASVNLSWNTEPIGKLSDVANWWTSDC